MNCARATTGQLADAWNAIPRHNRTQAIIGLALLCATFLFFLPWGQSQEPVQSPSLPQHSTRGGVHPSPTSSPFPRTEYAHLNVPHGPSGESSSKSDKIQPLFDRGSTALYQKLSSPLLPDGFQCDRWAVVTTQEMPSAAIMDIAHLPDWCLVIVADMDPIPLAREGIVVLRSEDQKEFMGRFSTLVEVIPDGHIAKKNVGYLFAIRYGAKIIWDFEDSAIRIYDADLSTVPSSVFTLVTPQLSRVDDVVVAANGASKSTCSGLVLNYLRHMDASPPVDGLWPRGFPLDCIGVDDGASLQLGGAHNIAILQSLADRDPDLDAVGRLAHQSKILSTFVHTSGKSIAIPEGLFIPLNAQALMVWSPAFWTLLLPATVHSSVSDIWRGYIGQRIMWDYSLRAAVIPPKVQQHRDKSDLMALMEGQSELFSKTPALIRFLAFEWTPVGDTIPQRMEHMMISLQEHGFVHFNDVVLAQNWLHALSAVGYTFPALTTVAQLPMQLSRSTQRCHVYTRVLVTGISGMIGSHVARELVAKPCYKVYGLVRPRSNLDTLVGILQQVTLITGDIADTPSMYQLIQDVRPDYIYHFAAQAVNGISYNVPELTLDTNVLGTLNLLEGVRRAKITPRILVAGSSTEYGKTADDLVNAAIGEDAPLQPVSPYGVSKVATENLAFEYWSSFGIPSIVARFFIQVGVGGTDSLAIHQFCKQIAMAEKKLAPPVVLHGNIASKRDMTDARDSAPVIIQLAETGTPGESYNVGTGNAVAMSDLLNMAIASSAVPIQASVDPSRYRAYDENVLLANISKLSTLTSWVPTTDMKDTVKSILDYWRRRVAALYLSPDGAPLDPSQVYKEETVENQVSERVYDASLPRAALVTIFSEARRSLLKSLPGWRQYMGWMKNYDLVVFYVRGGADDADLAAFHTIAPDWNIKLIPFEYDPAWQTEVFRGGGGGGAYINWILAYNLYFATPELDQYEYMMRFDDDIEFFENSTLDIFADMKQRGIEVGWAQHIFDNEIGLQSPLYRDVQEYVATAPKAFQVSDVWPVVTHPNNTGPYNTFSTWRPYLTAGCVEMYKASVFRNENYREFLEQVHAATNLKQSFYWEQELKTMWQQVYVPAEKWRCYGCALPIFHKETISIDHWFFSKGCSFPNHTVMDRGRCDVDPEMRFC
jgi:GDP-4-dehydro-6-deoxy-D-mannose reductase